MNFLNVINKCLTELNYKPVNTFAELTKNEHKKIMNILNVLNSEVCMYAKWNFLVRKYSMVLAKGKKEFDNPINGRISQLIIGGHSFKYCENVGELLIGQHKGKELYSYYQNKIVLAKTFEKEQEVQIVYYTNCVVTDVNGVEKDVLEFETDKSLIPLPFLEPVLVYGTCMRLKGNQQHIRFNYWVTMYKEALANMVSKCSLDIEYAPVVKLKRT